MISKIFVLFCTVAALHAGILHAPAELAYTSSYNTISAPRAMIKTPVYNSITYSAPISYVPAPVGVHTPAIGSTSQNVIRSFDGTVSQYAKAVDTAFSSVRKYDTRVNNNIYSPAIATKIIGHANSPNAVFPTYADPAAKTFTYSAPVTHVSFNGFGTHYGW